MIGVRAWSFDRRTTILSEWGYSHNDFIQLDPEGDDYNGSVYDVVSRSLHTSGIAVARVALTAASTPCTANCMESQKRQTHRDAQHNLRGEYRFVIPHESG